MSAVPALLFLMQVQILETEKVRNLTGTQYKTSTPLKHAPGWNEYLATASEASVKVLAPAHKVRCYR